MLTWFRRRLAREDGISLVEIMVAAFILGIAMTAMASSSMAALLSSKRAQDQVAANQYANAVVEDLMSWTWAQVVPAPSDTSRTLTSPATTVRGSTFTPTVTSTWINDPCNNGTPQVVMDPQPDPAKDYLRFTVLVAWTDGKGTNRSLTVETYRFPRQSEYLPGMLENPVVQADGSC